MLLALPLKVWPWFVRFWWNMLLNLYKCLRSCASANLFSLPRYVYVAIIYLCLCIILCNCVKVYIHDRQLNGHIILLLRTTDSMDFVRQKIQENAARTVVIGPFNAIQLAYIACC